MNMRISVACLVVMTFALMEGVIGQSHTQEWGSKTPIDRELHKEIVAKPYSTLRIVTQDFEYQGTSNITYIKATDQYVNDNGGYATLLKGGIGSREVTIHLKSRRNHGFNFIIEIWGH